jgi:hypothetical protein
MKNLQRVDSKEKEKNRFNDCIVVFKLVEVAEVAEEVEVLQ